MRILLVLICNLALAFTASGAQEKKKDEKPAPKKPAQTTQGTQQRGGPKAVAEPLSAAAFRSSSQQSRFAKNSCQSCSRISIRGYSSSNSVRKKL